MKDNQVVLTYAWGTPNAGDHALTLGAIELLLKHVKEEEITVISRFSSIKDLKDPTLDIKRRYPKIEVIESPFKFSRTTFLNRFLEKSYGLFMMLSIILFPRMSIKLFKNNHAIQSIINAKIVLCNGGNLFYWNEHRRSLPRLLALIMPFILAKNLKVPYAFLPQTMGPIDNSFLMNQIVNILNSAEFVLFRDSNSYDYMKNFLDNKKTRIELSPDLAFVVSDEYKLMQDQVFDSLKKCGIDRKDKYIAVTLRASKLGDPEGLKGDSVDSSTIKEVTDYLLDVILPVAQKRNLHILVVEQTDVDNETSHYFKNLCKKNFSNKVAYLSSRDPMFLSALYMYSECLVGMRLHSLIFALRVNKPAFALYMKQFGPKTPGIYATLKLSEYCIDIEDTNSKTSSNQLDYMIENHLIIEKELLLELNVELEKQKNIILEYLN